MPSPCSLHAHPLLYFPPAFPLLSPFSFLAFSTASSTVVVLFYYHGVVASVVGCCGAVCGFLCPNTHIFTLPFLRIATPQHTPSFPLRYFNSNTHHLPISPPRPPPPPPLPLSPPILLYCVGSPVSRPKTNSTTTGKLGSRLTSETHMSETRVQLPQLRATEVRYTGCVVYCNTNGTLGPETGAVC